MKNLTDTQLRDLRNMRDRIQRDLDRATKTLLENPTNPITMQWFSQDILRLVDLKEVYSILGIFE